LVCVFCSSLPTYNQRESRATIDGRDVILLYGNAGELHETAIKFTTAAPPTVKVVSGSGTIKQKVITSGGSALALQFTTNGQTVVQVGDKTLLYILGELFLT
jgi:hypothetical protein